MDKLLLDARNAHAKRTEHKDIVLGMNFVECMECGQHAHVCSKDKLTLHGHSTEYRTISAEEF